jgi:hypothetical protein
MPRRGARDHGDPPALTTLLRTVAGAALQERAAQEARQPQEPQEAPQTRVAVEAPRAPVAAEQREPRAERGEAGRTSVAGPTPEEGVAAGRTLVSAPQ